MAESKLIYGRTQWREQIARLRAELEQLGAELVDREAELADRLAAISAFEFRLRAHIGPLSQKLAALEDEIALLRKQLQRLQWWDDAWDFETADFATSARWTMGEGAASAGDYRYHQKMAEDVAPPALDADEAAELKKHYRQLARRFHPDMAVGEADRAYRTQMMMAINAAYAAGDLARLLQLAQEPDAAQRLDTTRTEQQMAEALQKEVVRVQRRLAEIERELYRLQRHRSSRMMQQAEKAAAAGRDFFAEQVKLLHAEIAQRTAERDHVLMQIESMAEELEETAVGDVDIAELIRSVTLEQAYDDLSADFDDWIRRRRDPFESEDDILDDLD